MKEMIKISQDKNKLLKSLAELESDFEEGKISKRKYQSLKSEYAQELETLNAANRIRQMQGRGTNEKSLDHWVTKGKVEKDKQEEEELVNKFVRKPIPLKTRAKDQKGYSKYSILAMVFLAIAFFVGTGFGVYLLNSPVDTGQSPVIVNDTAFPLVNNATILTNTTSSDNNQKESDDEKTETDSDTNNKEKTDNTNKDDTNKKEKTDDNSKKENNEKDESTTGDQ
ncbi:hypothetical protein [Methanobacterium alcaliphilum]|uniref:hypothetical protein n=1 Tax=Methanobacterium alcaliphilum TaxID=392018 RepID=UPI00200A32AE|nr:hypothetical protein [Methanobacterium alcaliphilum]MCK9151471.1 hypothetical protein [Methanobacterium alcaliphilum]